MSNLNVSAALSAAIDGVIQVHSITEFTLDIQFTNTEDASYHYTPSWIESLTIIQSFAEKFADRVILELTLSPTDYMQLFNNSKGLQVSLRIIYYDSQRSQRVFTPPPIARTYKAMLMNPQDLSKKHTTGSLMPTASMPLVEQHVATRIPAKLSLIESDAYTIRQQKFHGIYQKQKITDVISHVAQSFNIKQMYLLIIG